VTRRTFLAASAALAAAVPNVKSKLGVAATSYLGYWRPKDTLEFFERCRYLGAAGIQARLSSLEPDYLNQLERRVKDAGMYLEVMADLRDPQQFEANVQAAKRIGALCVRAACLSGRRYETFDSPVNWNAFVENSRRMVGAAVAICDRHKFPLALENHKDWTAEEMVQLLKSYSSPYFGVCLDTGNNVALLDDPYDLVERLAPYAVTTHIKDMGVAEYADGFLLSEVRIGEGMLDMPRIVRLIQAARPSVKLTLEMITRDPLKVPIATDRYWATFPERKSAVLDRTIAMVRQNAAKLPLFSPLPADEQLRVENDNVAYCLRQMARES
jgi:sugar phosphate isomerase/epimerase